MRLGGHETFYPRPGWLTKGLMHLAEGKIGRFADPEVADNLGVGRNMSKAIGWWLYATGLVERNTKKHLLEISELGNVILRFDPFMTRVGTWWLIHAAAMATRTDISLNWFFSYRRPFRFSRAKLIQELNLEFELMTGKKEPSTKSVQREVALVLKAYSVDIPKPICDPEDNLGSPLQRLNLIHHKTATDHFERTQPSSIPPESLGICLSCQRPNQSNSEVKKPVTSNSLEILQSSALLGQNFQSTLELAELGQKDLGQNKMEVLHLAGERVIQFENLKASDWAQLYYDRLGLKNSGSVV